LGVLKNNFIFFIGLSQSKPTNKIFSGQKTAKGPKTSSFLLFFQISVKKIQTSQDNVLAGFDEFCVL